MAACLTTVCIHEPVAHAETRFCGYHIVRLVLGTILLAAAVMKGHELATGPVAQKSLLTTRWFLVLAVEFELVLALCLLSGLWKRLTWWVALASFAAFACITAYKVWHGETDCGCFGRIRTDPRYTLTLDLFAVASLLLFAPTPDYRPKPTASRRFAVVGAIVLAFSAALAYSMATLHVAMQSSDSGLLSVNRHSTLVLLPEKWPNKPFPLLPHVNIGSRLSAGKWLVLIYHQDCSTCQQAIPFYTRLARETAPVLRGRQVALLAMPPYPSAEQHTANDPPAIVDGKLSDTKQWIAETPVVAALDDGIVTGTSVGEAALQLDWLHDVNALEGRRLEGQPAVLTGRTLSGQPFSTASWKGKVILVDFWATWCGPCIRKIPEISQIYRKYHAQGLEVLGISNDTRASDLEAFLASQGNGNGLPWPQLFEPGSYCHPLAKLYGVERFPTVFLIDRRGILRSSSAANGLEEHVARLLSDPAGP
jgi:thiol-disulfide isomerase/thioredoxin/uncharacterized membrane protein YphA (DoxX/SURF4 family)